MVSGFGLGGLFRGRTASGRFVARTRARRRGGFVCLAAAMTLAVTAVPAPAFAPVRAAAMPRTQADAVPIDPCLDTGEVTLGGEYDVYYIHTDHRGAPVFLTDESAQVVWTTEYDPFGNALCDWGRVHQDATGRTECVPNDEVSGERVEMNLRLPGQYYDEESGLHYNWHRYYDPKIGRYLTPDKLIGSINPYTYASNEPMLNSDLTGLDAIYIYYKDYPVDVGYGVRLPLGHGAVVAVDPKTGKTKYYEFGRYDKDPKGRVKQYEKVPSVVIGPSGLPTPESLSKLYDDLSKNRGHGALVIPEYYKNSDYDGVIGYAEEFKKNHPDYDLYKNNCLTFGRSAATACEEGKPCKWAPK